MSHEQPPKRRRRRKTRLDITWEVNGAPIDGPPAFDLAAPVLERLAWMCSETLLRPGR